MITDDCPTIKFKAENGVSCSKEFEVNGEKRKISLLRGNDDHFMVETFIDGKLTLHIALSESALLALADLVGAIVVNRRDIKKPSRKLGWNIKRQKGVDQESE